MYMYKKYLKINDLLENFSVDAVDAKNIPHTSIGSDAS